MRQAVEGSKDPTTPQEMPPLAGWVRWKGTFYALAASLGFTCMGVCTKAGLREVEGVSVSVMELIFWRSIIVLVVALLLARRRDVSLKPVAWGWMSTRVTLGLIAMVFFFEAIGSVGLGLASTLLYTHPIWTALLGRTVLSEHLPRGAFLCVLVAFVGLVFMVGPELARFELGAIFGLTAGALAALSYMSVRALRKTDAPEAIVFAFAFVSAIATAPLAIQDILVQAPARAWSTWLVVLGVGLSATCGQLFITQALAHEKAGVVGVLSYTTVLMSFLCGVLFWHEPIGWGAAFGALGVVGGGAALTWLRAQENAVSPDNAERAGS